MATSLLIQFNRYHYLIVVAAMLVFSLGLRNQFNSWDDTVYITENPSIALNRQHTAQSFFKGETHGMYLPLTALSFSINNKLSAFDPKPYLVTNLIIHLLNIFLVIALLQKLFKNNVLTLFAGALFALHPLQAESVAYVAGRRDTLYAVFYFLALLAYINYPPRREKKWLYATLGFFVLSLFSKGQAIALPATLVLIDFILLKDFSLLKSMREKWLFVLLSLIFVVITLVVKQQSKEFDLSGQITQISFFQKLLFACYGIMMYVINTLLPYRLSLIHPYPKVQGLSAGIALALVFVVAFAWFLVRYYKAQKEIVAGLLFFVINIFLVLQLIPNSYGIMNDHYMYVPCIGIFIALYFTVVKLVSAQTSLYVFAGMAVLASVLLGGRIAVFKNSFTVFTDAIHKYPDSFVGYNNRGVAYMNAGNLAQAKADFDRSIEVAPSMAASYNNRATILLNLKQVKEAIADLNKAISLKPDFANAYSNRGIARSMLGDTLALTDLDKAIALNAADPKLYYNRAGYWMSRGKKDLACQDVAQAKQRGLKAGNPALDKVCN